MESDKLLVDRSEVNKALHLSRNYSFIVLPSSRHGKIRMADVVRLLRAASRKGAPALMLGDLLDINGVVTKTGFSKRKAHELVESAPHYHITNKCKLISLAVLEGVINKGK